MMEKHEMRDWAALPRDILLEIFGRLQHADVLRGAGLACASWWRAAVEEPTLWITIDIHFSEGDLVNEQSWYARLAMGRAAVDRSAGRCESFRGIADRDLLAYIVARAPSLRSLHVTSCWCLPEEFFDRVVTKLPMLERLVLDGGRLSMSTLIGLLEHCPHLEVLDAGNCYSDKRVEYDMLLKLYRKLKVFHLPRVHHHGCYCFCWRCAEHG
ncbi:unnamed protein product [Urochloa decumbens]|uniref:F-box domain-containing protein n=1 Tax=Urochloa decumbens TaxID=240449 RepID=A0ABC9BFW2_9POAL